VFQSPNLEVDEHAASGEQGKCGDSEQSQLHAVILTLNENGLVGFPLSKFVMNRCARFGTGWLCQRGLTAKL
jgi:hypothetical protein